MNRDRQDDAVRGLARATDEQVARAAGPEARAAVLEGIVQMPPTTTTPPRRRSRLRPALALAGVTLAATGAIGWSQFFRDAADSTALLCEIPNSPSIVDAVSGDPVTDCAAEWERQTGREAPPLAAFDNGRGGVVVQPAAAPVPAGYRPLPGGQNLALIQLDESLADYVAGLSSRCFAPDEATEFAHAQLARFGVTGWVVSAERAAGTRCVDSAAVDLDGRRVVLMGGAVDPSAADTKYNRLAERLRAIARKCRTLPAATAAVDGAVRDLGLSTSPSFREVSVTSVRNDERCTTIRQRVGGGITVTLRGPAG